MKKNFSALLFIAFIINSFKLNVLFGEQTDSLSVHIKKINYYVNSRSWQPVDSVSYKMIVELLKHVEGVPVDQVANKLKTELETDKPIFVKSNSNVLDIEKVKGYISENEINKHLDNIAKQVSYEFPWGSIQVPESNFVNMNSKLPLVSFSNMEKLLEDSLISLPDSINDLIKENNESVSEEKISENKKIIEAFLSIEREKYNSKLIKQYRDSVVQNYRSAFIEDRVNKLRASYLDSVSQNNSTIASIFSDKQVVEANIEIRGILERLIKHANSTSNTIEIYNRNNDLFEVPLQNDTLWFKWVWLKNSLNDSLGIRIENMGRNAMRIYVDEMVDLSRLTQRQSLDIEKITNNKGFDPKLMKVEIPKVKVSPWKLAGRAYSGFTQTYINDYWSKGGKSSASTLSTFNYSANLMLPKLKWENWIDAKLGLIYYMPEEGSTALRNWHKNSDNFEINSRLGISAFKKWYYSADANFKTQFFLGFSNNNAEKPNSSFFSPGYLTFSLGLDYKPSDKFSAFISPVSLKTTYVTNPEVNKKNFGLAEDQTRKSRIGTSGKVEFTKKLIENVSLRSKSSVFVNLGKNNDGEAQWSKFPDFDSENSFDFKVNQFITTQVNFHLIYDKDAVSVKKGGDANQVPKARLQVKEFITFGVSYKF